MKYKKYETVLDQDTYYKSWDEENVKQLTDDMLATIYNKYKVKCKIFQRDSFLCQNVACRTPGSKLTMHHVKWRKNGGEDKVRNGVTLCRTCHDGYHRAKHSFILANADHVPPHLRGQTFMLSAPDPKKDWKKLRAEMKVLRNRLKQDGFKAVVSWEQVHILMCWLFGTSAEDMDNDDDD
jgi:hypothetical protein